MKIFNKTLYISTIIILSSVAQVFAAHMYISSPSVASSNRESLALSIILDQENDVVSGLSGNFSFPEDLFDVKSITTQNGIVSLWINQPHVSDEKTFDGRTHIDFEGIIPGGFSGVHNPYFKGVSPGIVFTVTLIPKNKGNGQFTLKDVELHAYDSNGSLLLSNDDSTNISVPNLSGKEVSRLSDLIFTDNKTISMAISKSEFVDNNAPFLYVHEEDPSKTVDHIEIAESSEYNPNYVSEGVWHKASNPYLLIYTSRTKYIHAKIIYTNDTYTYKTLPPVENSQAFLDLSHILLYILVAISLLYHYGKNFLYIFKKSRTKH